MQAMRYVLGVVPAVEQTVAFPGEKYVKEGCYYEGCVQ